MNTAIIVAAGSGTRFRSEKPKQFIEINGKPLLVHTLERFSESPSVDAIILVVASDQLENTARLTDGVDKVSKVVVGGSSRTESVRNGLDAVDSATEIVAIHDGARPLVSVDEIERTIAAAAKTGAACLVAEVTDTIKAIRGDEVAATLDRNQLRRALTPQAFKIEILRKAFENAKLGENVTDECYLVEKLGYPITAVEGSSRNIKITREEDLILAEALLRS